MWEQWDGTFMWEQRDETFILKNNEIGLTFREQWDGRSWEFDHPFFDQIDFFFIERSKDGFYQEKDRIGPVNLSFLKINGINLLMVDLFKRATILNQSFSVK